MSSYISLMSYACLALDVKFFIGQIYVAAFPIYGFLYCISGGLRHSYETIIHSASITEQQLIKSYSQALHTIGKVNLHFQNFRC